jgi:hypothetical protein
MALSRPALSASIATGVTAVVAVVGAIAVLPKFDEDEDTVYQTELIGGRLTAAIIAVNRRNHEQTTPAEPLTGLPEKSPVEIPFLASASFK